MQEGGFKVKNMTADELLLPHLLIVISLSFLRKTPLPEQILFLFTRAFFLYLVQFISKKLKNEKRKIYK